MPTPRVPAALLFGVLLAWAPMVSCYEELPRTESEDFFLQMAEASCEFMFETCTSPGFASMETCVTQTEQDLRERHEEEIADGRKYDAICANRVLQSVKGDEDVECDAGCTIYPGDKKEGESCTADASGSDCKQGLACSDRMVCVRYVDVFAIPQGQKCRDVQGTIGTCAEGFACSGGDICVTAPALGETCLAGASGTPSLCDKGHYCEPTSLTCVELKADGSACEQQTECQSGICMTNTCGTTTICEPPDSTGTCF